MEIEKKLWKYQKKWYRICLNYSSGTNFACGICELHAKQTMFSNAAGTWENLFWNLKMEVRPKIPLTIRAPHTHQNKVENSYVEA